MFLCITSEDKSLISGKAGLHYNLSISCNSKEILPKPCFPLFPMSHLLCFEIQAWVWKICGRRDRLPTPVLLGFPCSSAGKECACNMGDLGLIPGLGTSPGEGKGNLLQYSGLENSVDCIVHGVSMSRTWLIDFHCWDRSSITLLSHHSPSSLVLLNTCWYFQGIPPEASAPHLLDSFKNLSFSSVINHFH